MKSQKKKVLFDMYSPARRAHSARILASMRHHRSPRLVNAANTLVSLRKRRSRSPSKKRKSRSPKRKSSKKADSLRLRAQIMKSRM